MFLCEFLARLYIKSNARISLNIGFFFKNYLIRAAFTLGAPTKKKGQHIWIGTPKVNSKNVGQCGFMQQQSRFFFEKCVWPLKGPLM